VIINIRKTLQEGNIVSRLGLEQDELKSIMQDILEMDLINDWEVRPRRCQHFEYTQRNYNP